MRLLLDESLPRQLGREFGGHEVTTVARQGWAGLKNGELLQRAAADGFGVLITGDRNIQYQQNVPTLGVAVVVLVARSNRIEDLVPLVPEVLSTLSSIQPGELREIGGSSRQPPAA